ncbi:MAG: hypothetical protein KKF88_11810 [Alphaproteobacteria bacterium]|nr:hypothetical protein [Alphaproteobacteria bacterium]
MKPLRSIVVVVLLIGLASCQSFPTALINGSALPMDVVVVSPNPSSGLLPPGSALNLRAPLENIERVEVRQNGILCVVDQASLAAMAIQSHGRPVVTLEPCR